VSSDIAFSERIPAAVERRFDSLAATRLSVGGQRLPGIAGDHFRVIYVSQGNAVVRSADQRVTMGERDLLVMPADDMAWVVADEISGVLALRFEAGALALEARQLAAVSGRIWATDQGTASLLAHVLDALLAQLENYTPANPVRLQHHLGGFLAMTFVENADLVDAGDPLLRRAKDHIEERLGDLALRPDEVAAAINVSTRTLNRLFEAGGISVSSWIRQRRLERCRETLADPRASELTINSIGAQWGMCDAAHFSRTFKSAYGITPREFRRDAQRHRSRATLRGTAR
jgi:AraC-type DNA-binding domain-containing proteins